MTFTPDPHAAAPPSEPTGPTVGGDFPAGPPKRPGTVTAAIVLMFVCGALSVLGIIDAVYRMFDALGPNTPNALVLDLFHVFLAVMLTAGFIVAPILTLNAKARVLAFLLLGGTAFTVLTDLIQEPVFEFIIYPSGQFVPDGMVFSAIVIALTVTTIALLSTDRADTWFSWRRGGNDISTDTAPRGPRLAALLLGSIALLEVAQVGFKLIDMSITEPDILSKGQELAFFIPQGVPVLVAAVLTAFFVAVGRDAARTIALGLCGMLAVAAVTNFVDLVLTFTDPVLSEHNRGVDRSFYWNQALAMLQAVAAVLVIVSLAKRPVADWFHHHRNRRGERPTPLRD